MNMAIHDSPRRSDQRTCFGLIAWAATLCVVVAHTLFVSSSGNITSVYRAAAESLMRGEPLYPDLSGPIAGFLYLPGFAAIYIPFDLMGPRLGDAVWKVTGAALLTYVAWSSCRGMD